MSESTPAGIASRKIGSVAAAWTSATAAGAPDRSVTSQALATSRMKEPTLPMIVAAQSTAKTRPRSGAKADACAGLLSGVLIVPPQTAQQAQPSAPQKLLRSEIGSVLAQAPAWSWPWTPQELAQPQAVIAFRRREFLPAPSGSPQAP